MSHIRNNVSGYLKKHKKYISIVLLLSTVLPMVTGCFYSNRLGGFAIHEDLTSKPHIPFQVISNGKKTQEIEATILEKEIDSKSYSNLWNRVCDGLSWDIPSTNESVNREVLSLVNNPVFFKKISEKASKYLYYIVEEVENRNLPLELALMPIVESSFDPKAVSPAGAAGLWQIMPHTGKHFGLEKNTWYDGRYDIIAATNVALDYMEYLYKIFGDWELALAAFNSGPARVKSAIAKNKKLGKQTTFWCLSLPLETSKYVTKLVALSKILRSPKSYGVNSIFLANTPNMATINITKRVHLEDIAKASKIPLQKLVQFNPGLLRNITPPKDNYTLIVPIDKKNIVLGKINEGAILSYMKDSHQHVVKKNDSLIKIAKLYDISVKDIKLLNNMKNDIIKIGSRISIPIRSIEKNIEDKKTIKNKPVKNRVFYNTQKGDSLWSISKKHNVDMKDLMKWNNISSSTTPLQIGHKLLVWK